MKTVLKILAVVVPVLIVAVVLVRKYLSSRPVVLSPTNKALAAELEWYYDATQIRVPTFLISGAGGGDDWVVTGEQLGQIYADIRGEKLMVRRKDTPHNEVLYAPNGYVVAWLMWQLQLDQEAARAFTAPSPELAENDLYQDMQASLS